MLKDEEKNRFHVKENIMLCKQKPQKNKFWLKLYLFSLYMVMDLLCIHSQRDRVGRTK